jgi:hypothetical protein
VTSLQAQRAGEASEESTREGRSRLPATGAGECGHVPAQASGGVARTLAGGEEEAAAADKTRERSGGGPGAGVYTAVNWVRRVSTAEM